MTNTKEESEVCSYLNMFVFKNFLFGHDEFSLVSVAELRDRMLVLHSAFYGEIPGK